MPKAAFHNLGCKVNSYETESMQQLLEENGYEIVDFSEIADVYIINTCSVTNIADRKSRQMIHKARKMNKNAVIVAAGCYAQTSTEKIKEEGCVDIIIGNNNKHRLPELISEHLNTKNKTDAVLDIMKEKEYEPLFSGKTNEHTRAYIKIQDGCNQFCSYCIIPYARGRVRSRQEKDILDEIGRLAKKGYKEIVLTGIHLSSYGIDTDTSLIEIIERIHEIEGIERIRLGSLEPRIITEEFLERLSRLYKICPHFHLSLQSGSDTVLKRMNRRYTTEEYFEKCCLIKKYYDYPALTTDVIVGFPGETEEEFNETIEFIKRVKFFEVHVFKYSRRKGTKADLMQNQVPDGIKNKRSAVLLELTKADSKEFIASLEGKDVEALFEEKLIKNNETFYAGDTKEYVKVLLKSDEDLINNIVKGKIVRQNPLNFDDVYITIL